MEKGYALMTLGYYREAIHQFRTAANQTPQAPVVPVLLTEIAMAYNKIGERKSAVNELEKANALSQLIRAKETA
jgi:tetratricopeptide (TPR) repeat protein